MLKNYIKIAWRNLLRNKAYSAINIAGLATGISACILIFFYVKDELTYEQHFDQYDQIYRVVTDINLQGQQDKFARSPAPLAAALQKDYPEIQKVARLLPIGKQTVWLEDRAFNEEDLFFADSTFFEIFSYEFLKGNPQTALQNPRTVVISDRLAEKYFGSVDDQEDILTAGRIFLKQHFTYVRTESNPNRIPYLMQNERFDVIMLDMNYSVGATSSKEGFDWLKEIRERDANAVVILITAYGDVEIAVKALKEGATDFVLKPWQNEKLLATLLSATQLSKSKNQVQHLMARHQHITQTIEKNYGEFIGVSPAMQRVYQTIEKVGPTDANVLILGEKGTGKELAARALHRKSTRSAEAFINVDLGAVSETLFESELFGHAKGAYTDAKEDRAGRFETASGGTLFLDEIGNLTLPLQAKLLTALQSRQIIRLGTNKPIPINIRLVSATNMPLHEMVGQGRFRQDLLYRINTVEIQLPPLRKRKEDVKLLAEHFLTNYRRKYQKPNLELDTETLEKLTQYHWPGNIRELDHAIERAVIMSDEKALQVSDFGFAPAPGKNEPNLQTDLTLEALEKLMVQKMLAKYAGNITHAARELGITRTALYRRIEKHGL